MACLGVSATWTRLRLGSSDRAATQLEFGFVRRMREPCYEPHFEIVFLRSQPILAGVGKPTDDRSHTLRDSC